MVLCSIFRVLSPSTMEIKASSRNKWNFYYYFMSGSIWFLRSFASTCEVVLSWGHAFRVAPPVTKCWIASFIYLLYYIHSFLYNCSLYLNFVKSLCSWLDLVMRQLKAESKGSFESYGPIKRVGILSIPYGGSVRCLVLW